MTLNAVLLAGGESRRIGRDKAMIDHGEALWQRQLRVLRELKPQEIFVSARTNPGWYRPTWTFFSIITVTIL